jgi:hypothetical protein
MADLGTDVDKMLDNVEATVRYLAAKFGFTDVGGVRDKDQFPDHPGGYAADYMVKNRQQGDLFANWSTVHAREIGLQYEIWYGRVWNVDKDPIGLPWNQWRPYTSTDNPHTDHVHQTYKKSATPILTGLKDGVSGVAGKLFDLDSLMNQVEGTSVTLIAAGLGVILLGVGVVVSVRSGARSAIQKTTGVPE